MPTSQAGRDSVASLPAWLPPAADDDGNDAAGATRLAPNSSHGDRIETSGGEDWFRLETSGPRDVRVRTTGGLNTVGTLIDASDRKLASDDEGGRLQLRPPSDAHGRRVLRAHRGLRRGWRAGTEFAGRRDVAVVVAGRYTAQLTLSMNTEKKHSDATD